MSSIENSYNRPNFPYRCGRAMLWEKPCTFGPNADGSCGGVSACRPRRSGDRFTCRRRPEDGGPCADGPLPDGTCALTQPPCQPRRTLRASRSRLTVLALIAVIALIGAFGSGGSLVSGKLSTFRDPGQLLDVHAGVIGEEGCGTCHEPHQADAAGFIAAAFHPSGPANSVTNKCLSCHVLPNKASEVHKAENCGTCHTEHKGGIAAVTTLTDQQCHSCHKVKFTTFAKSHPEFRDTYPYKRRTAISFDHTKHLEVHFKDERYAKKAPEERCISCHAVSKASSRVPIKTFEEICAGCHEEQIASKEMAFFTLPEFEKNPVDMAAVAEACNGKAPDADAEYESVSLEPFNPVMAALLDVDPTDIAAYQEKVGRLLEGMASNGLEPFKELLAKSEGKSRYLLNGLSPSLLHSAACSWAANKEYEVPSEPEFGGWFASEYTLGYRPVRHRDPTMMAWLNFAASTENEMLSNELLVSDGPGSCIKCHSVSETDAVRVAWRPAASEMRAHHKYSHAPHLNLLGPGSECEACHTLNKKADYASAFKQHDPKVFNSNFAKIENNVCATCHRKGQVVEGCLTCHKYHEQTGFKDRMMVSSSATPKMGQ